jgi:hypothetical protein
MGALGGEGEHIIRLPDEIDPFLEVHRPCLITWMKDNPLFCGLPEGHKRKCRTGQERSAQERGRPLQALFNKSPSFHLSPWILDAGRRSRYKRDWIWGIWLLTVVEHPTPQWETVTLAPCTLYLIYLGKNSAEINTSLCILHEQTAIA